MPKLEIPKFRYIAQDPDGFVCAFVDKPEDDEIWCESPCYVIRGGTENQNWKDTLIDLECDDYAFEDGILKRIDK